MHKKSLTGGVDLIRRLIIFGMVTVCACTVGTAGAHAAPPAAGPATDATAPTGATGATIAAFRYLGPQRVMLQVHSAAMNKTIPVQLLLPADFVSRPSARWPTFYMLDGIGTEPAGTSHWTNIADTEQFFARKEVIVVQPTGADFTFFADWRSPDPVGGTIKWETFVSKELPDVLEHSPQWRASGARAISGLSMGAYGAMTIAARNPGFYRAVASYSGYPHNTIEGMPALVEASVANRSRFNPDNMYGDPNNPLWSESDPYNHPESFRDVQVYLSAGNGMPNLLEFIQGFGDGFLGIILEVISNYSSTSFAQRLQEGGIPVTAELGYPGTHSWPHWVEQYKKSWPTVARGLGIPPEDT